MEVQMAKFRPQRKQFGATSSPGQPAEDLNTPLIILDSDSEGTSDDHQKEVRELKKQFSPASEDIDPLLLVDDKTTEDLKMHTQVTPSSAPSLPVPCTDFVEVIEQATREALQQLGSSSPAWSSDSWEVLFQRKLIHGLNQRLPSLIKYHGLDQVRIKLSDRLPNHYDFMGEKFRKKSATTVWGLCLQVSPKSLTTSTPQYNSCNDDGQSVNTATWRPWQ